jgi:hypothetical protein
VLHEVLVVGGAELLYEGGRVLARVHDTGARAHAGDVWSFERMLHLPSEASAQRLALHSHLLIQVANLWYKYEHFVSLSLVTLFVLLVHPRHYLWYRRVLFLTTALALVGHFAYPLMPPRLRPDFGMADTGALFGQSVYHGEPNSGLLNQYAAMPSMHITWPFLFTLAVLAVGRSRWRWLIVPYPFWTAFAVIVTGNHYWLDGIIGLLLWAFALAVFRHQAPWARMTPCSSRGSRRRSTAAMPERRVTRGGGVAGL